MRQPDQTGPLGQMWRVPVPADNRHGLLAAWVIHAPQSHPYWPWVLLSLVHLRPLDNVPDPVIYLEGATHELLVLALDPKSYPPEVDKFAPVVMAPANFAAQLIVESDAAAVARIEREAVEPVLQGVLNPDTDGRQEWARRFGSNMMRE